MRPAVLLATLFVACGGPPPRPPEAPRNTPPPKQRPDISRLHDFGTLLLVPAAQASDELPPYVPISDRFVAFSQVDPPSGTWTAIDQRGQLARVSTGEDTQTPFGCDGNQLEGTPFSAQEKLAPGLAWMLPAKGAHWQPAPISISAATASETSRVTSAGPLRLELTRHDDKGGELAVFDGTHKTYTRRFELIEDVSDPRTSPVDLREVVPGIPELAAAWTFAPDGPYLVVLATRSLEGIHLETVVIDIEAPAHAHRVAHMSFYLYMCAY